MPYFQKRKAFEYEHEVRIISDADQYIKDYLEKYDPNVDPEVILNSKAPDICEIGLLYTVNVKTLINEVIISPYAEDWVTTTVKSIVHKYGYDFEVNSSTLLDDPV